MFGEKLKCLRQERGMTQAELAERLGVSPSAVGMYEQGRREPEGALLARIAAILRCSADELLNVDAPSEVSDVIDGFARTLESQRGLMYNGAPLSREDRRKLVDAIRVAAAVSSPRKGRDGA